MYVVQDIMIQERINQNDASNCDVGDVITWNMVKPIKQQMFGVITEKHPTCVKIDLLDSYKYDNKIHLKLSNEFNDVCKNKLLYKRKLMILKKITKI
jgi:hypothetical protein